MELGEPDASGRRRPVEVKGSEFVIDVDTVIMSLGTSPNPLISSTTKGLEINGRKCIIATEETLVRHQKKVYMPAVMPLQVLLQLSSLWVLVRQALRVFTNIFQTSN